MHRIVNQGIPKLPSHARYRRSSRRRGIHFMSCHVIAIRMRIAQRDSGGGICPKTVCHPEENKVLKILREPDRGCPF